MLLPIKIHPNGLELHLSVMLGDLTLIKSYGQQQLLISHWLHPGY